MLLLVPLAHAAPLTADQCATLVRNQAAWAGQSPATDLDAARLCRLSSAGALSKSDQATLLGCYTDAKGYATARCEKFRAQDTLLKAVPGCADWVRTAQGTKVEEGAPGGFVCQAGAGNVPKLTERWRCAGDPAYGASDACAAERARLAELTEFTTFKECRERMVEILTAELSLPAFVSLPRAPRETPTAEAVPWVAPPPWDTLGWRPPGDVQGVYWVEASGTTADAHCLIDTDGDGVPAELVHGLDEPFHRVTPAGVK